MLGTICEEKETQAEGNIHNSRIDKEKVKMPIYWIFIIVAVIVAINAEKISKLVMGTGKGKQIVIASCVAAVAILTIIIKMAL